MLLPRLLLLLVCGSLSAESITVGAFEYPPVYQNKASLGLAGDLTVAAFRAAGIDARLEFYPVARMVAMVSKGTLVCGLGGRILFADPDTLARVNPSATLNYVVQTFFYDQRRFPEGPDLDHEKAKQWKTGVLAGSGIMKYLSGTAGLELATNTSHEGSARQLIEGRIQLWAVVDLTGRMYLNELVPDQAAHFRQTKAFNLGDVSLVFSRERDPDSSLSRRFREGLAQIKRDGTYLKIVAKYYGGLALINREALTEDMR